MNHDWTFIANVNAFLLPSENGESEQYLCTNCGLYKYKGKFIYDHLYILYDKNLFIKLETTKEPSCNEILMENILT